MSKKVQNTCCGVTVARECLWQRKLAVLALWGRLRRELAVFQGVGAQDAGVIFLTGFKKERRRRRGAGVELVSLSHERGLVLRAKVQLVR